MLVSGLDQYICYPSTILPTDMLTLPAPIGSSPSVATQCHCRETLLVSQHTHCVMFLDHGVDPVPGVPTRITPGQHMYGVY